MKKLWVLLPLASSPALAGVVSVDLSNYQYTAAFPLPPVSASEASAVTFNPDTGTLFVLGDEGDALVEVTRTGVPVSTMLMTGFDDTEGLTYVGGGQFVLVEERLQTAYRFTYAANGTLVRSALQSSVLGPTVGNVGLEGISYDPANGQFITVKEKTPQAVRTHDINFATGAAASADLFTPNLSVLDLSDVQALSTVESLAGTPDADNLLIYSQESFRLMEVTRAGSVQSSFSFAGISDSAEGVTIDDDGVIYIVDETPTLHVLSPIPEPTALALVAAAFAPLRRRR